jgi:hypothetical protein
MVSRKRVVGFATIFCLTCVVAADGTLARTAGFGGGGLPVLPGLHNSISMAPFHGSPPSTPVLGHRRITFRAPPARQFGFGIPLTTFGYGFSGKFRPAQAALTARPPGAPSYVVDTPVCTTRRDAFLCAKSFPRSPHGETCFDCGRERGIATIDRRRSRPPATGAPQTVCPFLKEATHPRC